MNPMDLWNLITVDPTSFVRELRVWLHNISFEVWMQSLGGVMALLGLGLQAKSLMIASDARAFAPILLRVGLVAALVAGQQPLRIAAEGWYGDLYRWGQDVIRQNATEASDHVTGLSVTLGAIGIGWAGYKAGAAMAAAKGSTLPEISVAGGQGAVKLILGAGQFIFALLLPIYMGYYVTMLLAGVMVTLGIAVLPFVASLALLPGMGGTSALIGTTRVLITTFFVMVFMPNIFNLCLSVSWNAPARVVDQALTAAWQNMEAAWSSYSVSLGIPGVDQAATAANLVLSGDGFGKVGEAVVTALLALIGGIAMIVIGMIASVYIVRQAVAGIGSLVGGIAAGATGAVGGAETGRALAFGGAVAGGALSPSVAGQREAHAAGREERAARSADELQAFNRQLTLKGGPNGP